MEGDKPSPKGLRMTDKMEPIAPATPSEAAGTKRPWKAPEIKTMEARDGEASFTYGGVDTGIYHS
jgi:hypothetical protein